MYDIPKMRRVPCTVERPTTAVLSYGSVVFAREPNHQHFLS